MIRYSTGLHDAFHLVVMLSRGGCLRPPFSATVGVLTHHFKDLFLNSPKLVQPLQRRPMAKLILNTEEVEEDFFSDCRLMAIGSALPGYTLCWWLNRVCDFNFIRQPDMDVCVQEGRLLAKKGGSLFDTVADNVQDLFYFPVYKHDLPYYEACVYLYTNNFANKKLIPELKFADYLLLIPFASYIDPEDDVYKHLANIQDISWTRDIDLESLKNKKHLIV